MVDRAVLESDLDAIFGALEADWEALRGKRIFMTGGTGLLGRWMLESLAEADRRLRLGVSVTVLTRDSHAFAAKAPNLANYPGFAVITGDVLNLNANGERYDLVVHAATDASASLNESDPRLMFDTVVTGTRRALDYAVAAGAERFYFFSSGAVYGAQPPQVERVPEGYLGGPDLGTHRNAYAEGKRAAEMLCTIYARQFGLDIVTARIFALLGPLLSLDIHFAAGNFIRDAIAGRKVVVQSAGTAVRSYLYLADVTTWLWTILVRAKPGAIYNVGSEDGVSVGDLAQRVARLVGNREFELLGQADSGWNPGRYVPSTEKIRQELGVLQTVGLDDAILRTANANGWSS